MDVEEIRNSTLEKLWSSRYIQYIDCEEELNTTISLESYRAGEYYYPGGEFSFSYMMAVIPAANTNSGPRSSLALRFVGQALGEHRPRPDQNYSPKREYLFRAEPSLLQTNSEKHYKDNLGLNILATTASYKDYTCEDALVLNNHCVDRGMLYYMVVRKQKIAITPGNDGKYNLLVDEATNTAIPHLGGTRSKRTHFITNQTEKGPERMLAGL